MKFIIETLGCKVNIYESNVMMSLLKKAGFKEGSIEDNDIDIVIINTCTVTNKADNKSLKTVRKLVKKYPKAYILVTVQHKMML